MNKEEYRFGFDVYNTIKDLSTQDAWLLSKAREVTAMAYAPYSHFLVGAVAGMVNGETVTGTNQENASYPVGFCAERTLLATAASLYPNVAIETIAISYNNTRGTSTHPISPCGLCRQNLCEFEQRVKQPIRLVLSGMEGKIYVIQRASYLLPLSFGSEDMK